MVQFRRTHTCGDLRAENIGAFVVLSGWVHRLRNMGGLIFIDIRDRFGMTQIVLDPVKTPQAYKQAEQLRQEYVITVSGEVVARKDPNKQLATGQVEICAKELHLLSSSEVLPLIVSDESMVANDELRLQYRYLDMRRGPLLKNLSMRHKAQMSCRAFLDKHDFVEVTTPILGKSTPEGARDYLVPSRVHPGTFYALPQSPQLYKQILMCGGLDRYFQFATCFRDEDLRADRQPEFAQIDMEMSFSTEQDLFPIVEGLMSKVFDDLLGKKLPTPFLRMSYAECMELYGTDKPDLRFAMPFVRLTDLAAQSSFSVFHDIIKSNGIVKGFTVPQGADISRKEIDELANYLLEFGMKGLSWMKMQESGLTSPIAKFIEEADQKKWIEQLKASPNDLCFIVAGAEKKVNQALDHLRRRVAKKRNLIDKEHYSFLWVTDFPLFTQNAETQRIESEHHPFTSPNFDDMHLIHTEPLKMRSSSYDLVLNGYEIASGSQRIHDSNLQEMIFQILGLNREERLAKFGFFIDALQYGTPPHLGIAIGFDRLMMVISQAESIRDVIAFPKTLEAKDLMTQAPSAVSEEQLKELQLICKHN